MDKINAPFDQYQRYETIARLVEYHRLEENQSFQVLELGANEHKNLRLFLPNDQILFTDVALTKAMEQDPDFQWADGTDLPFDDKSFDFVIAADVFEHIALEKRGQFISEAYRVAEKGVILSFPYAASYIVGAESRVNTYYKTLAGEDFIWFKEHMDNSLPNLKNLNDYLNAAAYHYFSFAHSDIQTWEKMWLCNFDTILRPETVDYQRCIDRYYNEKIYDSDISDNCYRVFYVISRTSTNLWEKYAASLWSEAKSASRSRNFLDILLETHKSLYAQCEQNRLRQEQNRLRQEQNRLSQEQSRLRQEQNQLRQEITDKERHLALANQRIQNQDSLIVQQEQELTHYKTAYLEVQNAYNVISNAAFWKATKPLRAGLDFVKRLLCSNR